jgi:hypothetical protein
MQVLFLTIFFVRPLQTNDIIELQFLTISYNLLQFLTMNYDLLQCSF